MTQKLEQLFDLPPSQQEALPQDSPLLPDPSVITQIDQAIDKIDAALPGVRGLDASDSEMDELAGLAKNSYNDLMDLGMQVDSRFASEIFTVASAMLGHAITAKTAKLDKKLKMIDLQLKKARLDQQQSDLPPTAQQGQGVVLSRNELLDRIIASNGQKGPKA
jgi:hypothetical protein